MYRAYGSRQPYPNHFCTVEGEVIEGVVKDREVGWWLMLHE